MKKLIIPVLAALSLAACQKGVETPVDFTSSATKELTLPETKNEDENSFVSYTIPKGGQYCDKSFLQTVSYEKLAFIVKFDSSAIYKTIAASNQNDINKLFGFSDNNRPHHEFSARFGWRWSNDALRLFAYNYNDGVRSSKELGTVEIGKENQCSIIVEKDKYIFTLNGKSESMPRTSTTAKGEGYKLYPYFGGDEMAPHNITIQIKELVK